MKNRAAAGALAGVLIAPAGLAGAAVVPFTETFINGPENWRNAAGSADASWVTSGGPDTSSYITGPTNVNNASFGVVIALRGQDNFDSSNDAFVGDWLAQGVTALSFDVRHDASVPLVFGARIASPTNNPGASALEFAPVAPGIWTTITIAIDPSNPQFISFGSGTFNSVFSNIGNIQIIYSVPESLAGTGAVVNVDLDNPAIVPAPGALAALAGLGLAALRRRR